VGSFSLNLVPSVSLFSINLVRELARLSGRALYVLGPLRLPLRRSGQNRVVLIGNAVRSGTGSAEKTGSRRYRNLTSKARSDSCCQTQSYLRIGQRYLRMTQNPLWLHVVCC